jgi:hypothetical protein
MKLLILLLLGMLTLSACTTKIPAYQVDMEIVLDKTDPIFCKPDVDRIYEKTGLTEDMHRSVRITISTVSEIDVNAVEILTLPAGSFWFKKKANRKVAVARFKRLLQAKVDSIVADTHTVQRHTIFYRALCRRLNVLSHSKSETRCMYIYSDCQENDSISFYSPQIIRLLKHEPQTVRHMLEGNGKIGDLSGIDITLVYSPKNYAENGRYMVAACFFCRLFQRRHGRVHFGTNI